MKRTLLFILVAIFTLSVSGAKKKTTLEQLINKEWYEMNYSSMNVIDTSQVSILLIINMDIINSTSIHYEFYTLPTPRLQLRRQDTPIA